MAAPDGLNLSCEICGNIGFHSGGDGFYYCGQCHTQAYDIVETGVPDEDFVSLGKEPALYTPANRRPTLKQEPKSESRFVDAFGPTGPTDFGSDYGGSSFEDYYKEVRMKYVMGLQLMIQFQCEALTEQLQANPLICGLAGPIWLRFVALSKVFDDGWADEAIKESENSKLDDIPDKLTARADYKAEPHNLYGERAVIIWYRSLKEQIPLSTCLAVCFLACHVARDKILPTDIVKWSLEGKLPYFAAFLKIEESIGGASKTCPLSPAFMFRPSQATSFQKLEAMAASVALSVGLQLPPVNFFAIASRFLNELSLSTEIIIQRACRIYEWSMPSELWLSANKLRIPTRVCVMSILIVAIRTLYNLNGFGRWEATLSQSSHHDPQPNISTHSSVSKCEAGAGELLCMLEGKYKEIDNSCEYAKDLRTYLKYCKDVAFAGSEPSLDYAEEEKLIELLWNYYEDGKDVEASEDHSGSSYGKMNNTRLRDKDVSLDSPSKKGFRSFINVDTSIKDEEAIKRLISDMEENRFTYIPPRVNIKRLDYIHYTRKIHEGSLAFVSHADYYILLRSCAKVAQVDIRVMHMGVMAFERTLSCIEKKIDQCLGIVNKFGSQMDFQS